MKCMAKGCLLLLVLFMPGTVFAGEVSRSSLYKLMDLSGINKQLAELPEMVQAGIAQANQQGVHIPEADLLEIQKSAKVAFQPSKIITAMGTEIQKSLSEADAQKLLGWYESDLWKRIMREEADASMPESYEQMLGEAQLLLADQERVAIARDIISLVNATDMAMQLQENTGIAAFTALSKALEPSLPVDIDAFKSQMPAQEPQIRQDIEQLILLTYVYSYKNIDIDTQKKYVAVLALPEAKIFFDSARDGMATALHQSLDKMANAIAVSFARQKNG